MKNLWLLLLLLYSSFSFSQPVEIPDKITPDNLKQYFKQESAYMKLALVKANSVKEAYVNTRGHKFFFHADVKEVIYGNLSLTITTWDWGAPPSFLTEGKQYIVLLLGRKNTKEEHCSLTAAEMVEPGEETRAIEKIKLLLKELN